jgi:ubiquinone/menaquinone biosynthesis C-methylase UbiE
MTTTDARDTQNPAQFYEDYLVPAMFRPFAEELIARADPQPGRRVLDVACGTGIVARLAARHMDGSGSVVGFDLSPFMLEIAEATAADEGLPIEWMQGDAQTLPFSDASFDLVLCQQGLQPIPDKARALGEMWRVLVPGGRLLTNTWTAIEHHPLDKLIATSIHRHLGIPAFHAPFSLGDHGRLRQLFEDAGFTAVEIEVVSRELRFPSADEYVELIVIGGIAALPDFQSLDDGASAALIGAIRADIAGSIDELTVDGQLVIPAETSSITVGHKPA